MSKEVAEHTVEKRAASSRWAAVPALLKSTPRWVTWKAGPTKPNGKFDKIPVNPSTGRNCNGNDPGNWLSFADVVAAYEAGQCSGIGIALCDQPVTMIDSAPLYLVAVDLDKCGNDLGPAKKLRKDLGNIYAEISPSMDGIRMFALSRQRVKGGNAGNGRELYSTGRFVTVTGVGAMGEVVDATAALLRLEAEWFSAEVPTAVSSGVDAMTLALAYPSPPETLEHVAKVKEQLGWISADCSYEQWRNVVWSVLSSRWAGAEDLARNWSMGAQDRYDERAFDQLVRNFDSTRGITLGTLDHNAKAAGWTPQLGATPTTEVSAQVETGRPRRRLLTAKDLHAVPPMRWRLRGLLPVHGLAAIYGPSGSGKTFLALDMACTIADGSAPWFGAKVKAAPVVYVALEGEAGIQHRVRAWEIENGRSASNAMRFLLGQFTLLDPSHVDHLSREILEAVGSGAVVFVDTLNQSAPGADENSSVDMGTVISNAKKLAAAVEGMVILVHHAGKDQSRGMRGHSSLFAAMDTVIEVTSTASGRAWRVSKAKDGASGGVNWFALSPHVVGQDEDRFDAVSCAVRQALPLVASSSKPVRGKNKILAMEVLRSTRSSSAGLTLDHALRAVADTLTGTPPEKRMMRAKEAISSLTESGHLVQSDGVVVVT